MYCIFLVCRQALEDSRKQRSVRPNADLQNTQKRLRPREEDDWLKFCDSVQILNFHWFAIHNS